MLIYFTVSFSIVLGLSNSSPNMAANLATGETPFSINGYQHMLNYWKRLANLPIDCHAKKGAFREHEPAN